MKYTSKRGYNPARKSKRINRYTNQTGGVLGSKVTLVSTNKRKPKKIIETWNDLDGATITDENVSFKYKIAIDNDTIKLTNIQGFRTALLSNIKQLHPLLFLMH
jgi:hypothetical protein